MECVLWRAAEFCGILAGTALLLSRAWVLRASVCMYVCGRIFRDQVPFAFRLTLWECGIMWHMFRLRSSTCTGKIVGAKSNCVLGGHYSGLTGSILIGAHSCSEAYVADGCLWAWRSFVMHFYSLSRQPGFSPQTVPTNRKKERHEF